MIYSILILAGALIFIAAFPNYINIIKNSEGNLKKYWKALLLFTIFFLFGYIFQIAIELLSLPFDYRAMMSLVYLFGAVYVFAMVKLSKINMIEIEKHHKEEIDLEKIRESEERKAEYSKNLEKQVQERTAELEKRIKEIGDTKTAILNMMEDSDETNKELVKTQKNLEETITKLENLDKKKDEFISVAAHELKTPLTSIRGFSQLLQSETVIKDFEKRDKYLKIIEKETTRLAKLVTDILDLSRIDMGTFKLSEESVVMKKFIEDISKEADVMAKERGLEFKTEINGEIPNIIVDRGRLTEILLNLIGNSVKYTPSGSVTLKASADNSWIRMSVKDTGIGIDKKDQKRLFERFYQVDSSYTRKAGGTGLGLALSKEYLKTMGGDISFSSELGKGSEFVFRIPIKTGTVK